MRIALAQINSKLGDFTGNSEKILSYTVRAKEKHADLVVFPEAALFGYHPVDLLERPSVVKAQEETLVKLHKSIPKEIGVLVGAIVRNPSREGKRYWNAAVFLEKGKKPKVFAKQLLPTYDVFDESRHIEPGKVADNIFRFKKKRILVTICEDIWAWPLSKNPWYARYGSNPLKKIKSKDVDLVVNLSASPFTEMKFDNRRLVTRATVAHFKTPMVYVNMVGGQDELIFDGGSFALNKRGEVQAQSVRFSEDLNLYDLKAEVGGMREPVREPLECVRQSLVLGLRDFVDKSGFEKVHLGLSGGIDSALVACLATDALGPSKVKALYLPGPFSSKESQKWSAKLAENLGIELFEISIMDSYKKTLSEFEKTFGAKEFSVTNENLQARLRGLFLMAYSNQNRSMLLGTSNKSELAVGYSTLYGDMIGGLMPIGDLLKTQVFDLSRHYNKEAEVIPVEIIERPPSAELRADQLDQDSLPPYDQLDKTIQKLVLGFQPAKTPSEKEILNLMIKSEFKRWQSPPILKVSDHAFGRGRRFPVAHSSFY